MNSKKIKKIVIYGGAFNPPHIGHAVVIETVIRLFPCDEIWLMPTAHRKDKTISTDGTHRTEMLKVMIDELFPSPKIPVRLSRLELDRPRQTTTYDTALELKEKYPDSQFYFVIGSDIAGDIKTKWVNGEALVKVAPFIIFKRSSDMKDDTWPQDAVILEKDSVHLDFSSTFIRGLLKKDYSGVPYLSPAVAQYIQTHKLYR